jgi:hypothetical protein
MLKALKVIDFDVTPPQIIPFDQSGLKALMGTLIIDASATLFLRGLSEMEQKARPGTPVITLADGAVFAGAVQRSDMAHDPTVETAE